MSDSGYVFVTVEGLGQDIFIPKGKTRYII
ncbi:MAG: hypothetical protein ACMUEM_03310 [Flavobacteriales bacterium AspAUS03]